MASEAQSAFQKIWFPTMLVIVSAALGGVATYLVTINTQQVPRLRYTLSPPASFPSDKEAFAIQELRIINVGNAKETNIVVNILNIESDIADLVTRGSEKPVRATVSSDKRHATFVYERLPPQKDLFIKLNRARGITEQSLDIYGDHGPASVKIESTSSWWAGFSIGIAALCAILLPFQLMAYYHSRLALQNSLKTQEIYRSWRGSR